MRRAARRDVNEAEIVRALEQVGAAVQRLSEPGCPDLLCSFRGVLYLLEVKLPLTARGAVQKGRHRAAGGEHDDMTPAQVKWWREWRGVPPVVVRSVDEALAAIGIRTVSRRLIDETMREFTCASSAEDPASPVPTDETPVAGSPLTRPRAARL